MTWQFKLAVQNAIEQPPKYFGRWVGTYVINIFVVVWVLIVGFGFGGWASMVNFIHQIDTFGLFTKCYQCPSQLPPHLANATTPLPPPAANATHLPPPRLHHTPWTISPYHSTGKWLVTPWSLQGPPETMGEGTGNGNHGWQVHANCTGAVHHKSFFRPLSRKMKCTLE